MNKYKVLKSDSDKDRGTIKTPYSYKEYYTLKQFEINYSLTYKGMYCFAKYGLMQFHIASDSLNKAIEMAKQRIDGIFNIENILPSNSDIFEVSGFRYDENNIKKLYELSFMENTHMNNPFTSNSYKTKKGDLLKHDVDGDGWGFWYVVDENGNRISERLKGGIFIGYLSDGVLTKYNKNNSHKVEEL